MVCCGAVRGEAGSSWHNATDAAGWSSSQALSSLARQSARSWRQWLHQHATALHVASRASHRWLRGVRIRCTQSWGAAHAAQPCRAQWSFVPVSARARGVPAPRRRRPQRAPSAWPCVTGRGALWHPSRVARRARCASQWGRRVKVSGARSVPTSRRHGRAARLTRWVYEAAARSRKCSNDMT